MTDRESTVKASKAPASEAHPTAPQPQPHASPASSDRRSRRSDSLARACDSWPVGHSSRARRPFSYKSRSVNSYSRSRSSMALPLVRSPLANAHRHRVVGMHRQRPAQREVGALVVEVVPRADLGGSASPPAARTPSRCSGAARRRTGRRRIAGACSGVLVPSGSDRTSPGRRTTAASGG